MDADPNGRSTQFLLAVVTGLRLVESSGRAGDSCREDHVRQDAPDRTVAAQSVTEEEPWEIPMK